MNRDINTIHVSDSHKKEFNAEFLINDLLLQRSQTRNILFSLVRRLQRVRGRRHFYYAKERLEFADKRIEQRMRLAGGFNPSNLFLSRP
jgi:hypothetical protein